MSKEGTGFVVVCVLWLAFWGGLTYCGWFNHRVLVECPQATEGSIVAGTMEYTEGQKGMGPFSNSFTYDFSVNGKNYSGSGSSAGNFGGDVRIYPNMPMHVQYDPADPARNYGTLGGLTHPAWSLGPVVVLAALLLLFGCYAALRTPGRGGWGVMLLVALSGAIPSAVGIAVAENQVGKALAHNRGGSPSRLTGSSGASRLPPTTMQTDATGTESSSATAPTSASNTPSDKAGIPESNKIVDQVSAKYDPEIARARLRTQEDEKLVADQKDVVVAQTAQFRRAAEQQKLKELEQKLAEDRKTVERLMLEEKEEVDRLVREEKEEAARREAEAARRKQQEALEAEPQRNARAEAARKEREAAESPATKVELTEAVVKGLIKVSASGDGLESVRLSIESTSDDSLEVTITAGTLFQAGAADTQNMVTREESKVTLRTRGSKHTLTIDAACASMDKDTPGASDTFTISKSPASDDLRKLVSLPAFRHQSFRIQQFAIWTITDNPNRDGYVGLGEVGFFGSGPSADELQTIETLFEEAGVSTRKYRALR